MEALAYIKYIKISPKKLRFIADGIRKQKPADALIQLSVSQAKGAKMLYKAIRSAVYNARAVHGVKSDVNLKFKTLLIEEGPYLKRMRAASRGRAHFYKKRSSHIKVIVTGADAKKPTQVAKVEKKTTQAVSASKAMLGKKTAKKQVKNPVKKNNA